jgi:hypothetical protein
MWLNFLMSNHWIDYNHNGRSSNSTTSTYAVTKKGERCRKKYQSDDVADDDNEDDHDLDATTNNESINRPVVMICDDDPDILKIFQRVFQENMIPL